MPEVEKQYFSNSKATKLCLQVMANALSLLLLT